ncbi:MAG: DUF485 domain-containing protein [Candidatus Dormiibacterota bacterium]
MNTTPGDVGRSSGAKPIGPQPVINWDEIEASSEFHDLMAAKRRFVAPAVAFFLVYYFALPLSNGLAPQFMSTDVIGHINLAYLFALSEFVMAWVLAYVYIARAGKVFDQLADVVRRRSREPRP